MSVASSMGSPTVKASMAPARRSRKGSNTASRTMNRLAAMQAWPVLLQRDNAPTEAALSRSASGRTMKGSLPPSSSTDFLIRAPAAAATLRPAGSLPVRLTAKTESWSRTLSTCRAPMSRVRKTSAGSPAWANTDSMARAHWGTLEACLRTTALPAMSDGAAMRKTCHRGKFQGMTASTVPKGSNTTMDLAQASSTGRGASMASAPWA